MLRHEQETLLVVANLSRFPQPVELDLSAFKHAVPVELFGRTEFPAITERPYFLTLGPHDFYLVLAGSQTGPGRRGPGIRFAGAASETGGGWGMGPDC